MNNNQKELINRIVTMLEIDMKDFDENFLFDSSNLDSLAVLTLMASIDELFNVQISSDEIFSSKNIAGLFNLIDNKSI
jgi:acyl carrier protein